MPKARYMVIPSLMILRAPLVLLAGWLLDRLFGDPPRLPHLIVLFGKMIGWCERHLNHGSERRRLLMGALVSCLLVLFVFAAAWLLARSVIISVILVFYCLAGTTLVKEVKAVFRALDNSIDEGRRQVARIVGRDTAFLTENEVRTAALETLSENLSDGVIAPMFWFAILGVPGMVAYKMINTLDSMIGYRTERYNMFGRFAARLDDVANYLPARLTALLILLAAWLTRNVAREGEHSFRHLVLFIKRYANNHASPNSGYPEAALAAILDCRFGGTHDYFGKPVYKPYIGDNERPLTDADLHISVTVCRTAEFLMLVLTAACCFL